MNWTRRGVAAVAAAGGLACTDPRARPVPPDVVLTFPQGITVTSPDTIAGSLYAFDSDGLEELRLVFRTDDGTLDVDSLEFVVGENEIIRPVTVVVPAGVPAGTGLRVVVRVSDAAGFTGADSSLFAIQ